MIKHLLLFLAVLLLAPLSYSQDHEQHLAEPTVGFSLSFQSFPFSDHEHDVRIPHRFHQPHHRLNRRNDVCWKRHYHYDSRRRGRFSHWHYVSCSKRGFRTREHFRSRNHHNYRRGHHRHNRWCRH